MFSPETALGTALIGGLLIGLSSAILMLINGRITGISGILGGLLVPSEANVIWRVVFIAALIVGALVASWFGFVEGQIRPLASMPVALLAGVLVGIGTRFGAGCTSGHGICGMSRFSTRSFVAVGVFMATGFATASFLAYLG
ncbi:MAG: YeeE/YedE family protein [Alphaproteobacteria bacterium]